LNIDKTKFLALTASLAAATAIAAGCTVTTLAPTEPGRSDAATGDGSVPESDATVATDSGTNGSDGGSGDGASNADGAIRPDGALPPADGGSTADGGVACLDDLPTAGAMAPCMTGNPTGCISEPEGNQACLALANNGTKGVQREVEACLTLAPTCEATLDANPIWNCVKDAASKACDVPAATAACDAVLKSPACANGASRVTLAECAKLSSALNDIGRQNLAACFSESGGCALADDGCFRVAFLSAAPQ
jgi:hypothetical protein